MSDNELPREADVEQISRRLHQSLKACRAMVANYRMMLGCVANDNQPFEHQDGRVERASEAEEA